jgi:hypothetical protein
MEKFTKFQQIPHLWTQVAQWVRSLDLTTHTSLSPIRHGFAPGFVNYKKGCTRLAAASDKVYQLLAHGRWFSPASSVTKTGRHDIAEILLKVASKPIYGHLTLRHFRLYKVHSYLLTVLNTGFLQSDQVQWYIYKINWLNIKVLKTAASSKSINLYLYTFIIKCSQLFNVS